MYTHLKYFEKQLVITILTVVRVYRRTTWKRLFSVQIYKQKQSVVQTHCGRWFEIEKNNIVKKYVHSATAHQNVNTFQINGYNQDRQEKTHTNGIKYYSFFEKKNRIE